jgi:cytochrome c553
MKIILSAVVALFLIGCGDDKSTTATHEAKAVSKEVKTVAPVKTEVVEKVAVVEEKTAPKEEKPAVVEEKTAPVKEVVKKEVAAVDGAVIFKACSACHGANAEKKALGKSQIIKGWDVAKITAALKGYKDGTYGGAMKAVMKGQASKLSDAEIKAVAEHISKL